MMDTAKLIADLERAPAGSHLLDMHVALALGWESRPIVEGVPRPEHIGGNLAWRRGDMSWTSDGDTPPRYSQSIEAALREVPDDWDFIIGRNEAWIWKRRDVSLQQRVAGATPALALCRALLLAGVRA